MKKVYVLYGGCIGDLCVHGIFTSHVKAMEAKKDIVQKNSYYKTYPQDLYIEETELNKVLN